MSILLWSGMSRREINIAMPELVTSQKDNVVTAREDRALVVSETHCIRVMEGRFVESVRYCNPSSERTPLACIGLQG